MKYLKPLSAFLTKKIIRFYQILISPFLGNHCRFVPSCSEYANQSIEQFGIFKGTYKIISRLLRCHPFHPGGYDPISK